MIFTNEDILKHVRIGIYGLGGFLIGKGMDASLVALILGVVMLIVNYGWSLLGMRLSTKLKEMAQLAQNPSSPVKGVVLADTKEGAALAVAVPGPVIVEGTQAAKEIAASNGH